MTEGQNLRGLWDVSDLIQLDSLFSNDIWAMMETYGVEAGRACIIKEISSIFAVYVPLTIKVNLTLLVMALLWTLDISL